MAEKSSRIAALDWAVQNKNNRVDVNLGGGLIIELNPHTHLFFEAKYVAGDWDGFGFAGGIYF
jgi:hypothetical protein